MMKVLSMSSMLSRITRRDSAAVGGAIRAVSSRIPVISSLQHLREWRGVSRGQKLEVGVVPTMGALHQGHLDLVKRSLSKHPLTVMTLFVNPMQFAPTEDLSRYPRTLQRDLELLETLLPPETLSQTPALGPTPPKLPSSESSIKLQTPAPSPQSSSVAPVAPAASPTPTSSSTHPTSNPTPIPTPQTLHPDIAQSPLLVFAPPTDEMYPLRGELQNLDQHRGVGVEMRGWGDVMEGQSRPQFFKGVATVCTKLFNAVEPDHAYFGQKDIQQALLLKMMLSDLLLAHPLPSNLHIIPTTRNPKTSLALSSRNAYLTPIQLDHVAPVLYQALSAAREHWIDRTTCMTGEDVIARATSVIEDMQDLLKSDTRADKGQLKLDYIELFDNHTFDPIRGKLEEGKEMVLAGAIWVGQTRLIDNVLLGWDVE